MDGELRAERRGAVKQGAVKRGCACEGDFYR